MATGAAPALDPKVETKPETTEPTQPQPVTFRRRIQHLLGQIFQGREEFLGWRQ